MRFSLVLFMIMSANAAFAEGLSFHPAYDVLHGSTYDGSVTDLSLDVPVGTGRVAPGVRFLDRRFNGGAEINETAYDVNATILRGAHSYLETAVSAAPGALILPVLTVTATPHFVFGANDLSLGVNFSRYQKLDSGFLSPGISHEFSDRLIAGTQVFFARSDRSLTATHLFAVVKPSDMTSVRFDGAAGQTLEDAGLAADFNSLATEVGVRTPIGRIGVSFTRYWSTLRTEDGVGLRLELP